MCDCMLVLSELPVSTTLGALVFVSLVSTFVHEGGTEVRCNSIVQCNTLKSAATSTSYFFPRIFVCVCLTLKRRSVTSEHVYYGQGGNCCFFGVTTAPLKKNRIRLAGRDICRWHNYDVVFKL